MKSVTIHHGDSRDVLKGLADNSIDSVVTDPPYALVSIVKRFGGANAAEAKSEGASGVYKRASAGFMNKTWDTGETAFAPEFWAEVMRVLKPGGHVVAASGTRTYHRLAVAIEDAGFEVRDMISWLYGSGFPKSHDVSKGIDKAGGVCPKDQSELLRESREAAGLSRPEVAAAVGCTEASVRDWEEGRSRTKGGPVEWITASEDYRAKLADLLEYTADQRELVGLAIDRRGDATVIGLGHSGEHRRGGVSALAAQWSGWGTALKPACEPWVLARKPLSGTVAGNVLAHGTGALNIDACRIGWPDGVAPEIGTPGWGGPAKKLTAVPGQNAETVERTPPNKSGRWPANVIHDGSDEVVEAFGETMPSRIGKPRGAASGDGWGMTKTGAEYCDAGSAARFFYSAKADADDRMGSKHPTVKPIDLMRYLVRLITPPGGVVLDPFAGSGSTGVAAMLEGFESILIEREAEYVADIRRKVAFYRGEGRLASQEKLKAKQDDHADLPLFGGAAA